jgi:hypothetical protein
MRQPSGCGFARRNRASGATRASTASPAASERIQNAVGAVPLIFSLPFRFERADSPRRCGSGVQATGRERREESAQVAARQGRRCRDRSLRQGAILANGRARATNRQRRPLAREPSRLRPHRMDGSRNRSGSAEAAKPPARARKSRRQPDAGRCGVSPLERGGRDAGSNTGKNFSPEAQTQFAASRALTDK